ncbi:hypothetical protein [Bosea sp. (in: a-proteobacteria)]|uniref:hypothetical protein n=1 Tax=Bosea sp. (in: a-proteobacteria) TaxID=1871050 RepID=UPI0031FEB34F
MPDRVHNVLFLCTHNSARSIMASLDQIALAQPVRRIGGLEGASGGRPEVA